MRPFRPCVLSSLVAFAAVVLAPTQTSAQLGGLGEQYPCFCRSPSHSSRSSQVLSMSFCCRSPSAASRPDQPLRHGADPRTHS